MADDIAMQGSPRNRGDQKQLEAVAIKLFKTEIDDLGVLQDGVND
jgi:hypothetical protein